jgi:hypothetical protein
MGGVSLRPGSARVRLITIRLCEIMPEHLIRLRGGWLHGGGEDGRDSARRVSLPLEGPPRGISRVVLSRRFGRPSIDPSRERLALRLEGVVGLVGIRLNGRAMAVPPEGTIDLELSPDELRPSGNVLVLDVLPPAGTPSGADDSRWGMVALVISRPDPADFSGPAGGLLGDGPREA